MPTASQFNNLDRSPIQSETKAKRLPTKAEDIYRFATAETARANSAEKKIAQENRNAVKAAYAAKKSADEAFVAQQVAF